jgi:hypothetical protein
VIVGILTQTIELFEWQTHVFEVVIKAPTFGAVQKMIWSWFWGSGKSMRSRGFQNSLTIIDSQNRRNVWAGLKKSSEFRAVDVGAFLCGLESWAGHVPVL